MLLRFSVAVLAVGLAERCFGNLQAGPRAAAESSAEVLAGLPACAATCLSTSVSNSTCSPTDIECICNNEAINAAASQCILGSCSAVQALSAKNITSVACHAPVRDKTPQYRATAIALGVITVLFVVARITFKLFFSSTGTLGRDDKVILGTLAIRIASMVLDIKAADNGLGKDVWTLPPDEVTSFTEYLYILVVLYLAEVALIKISLTFFYLYIFPGTTIRRLLWGTIIFTGLLGFAQVTAAIFNCTPVSHYWTQYMENTSGHCVDINAFGWTNGSLGVATDVWMLYLPLSQIHKLRLHWKKKIGVVIMFLLGAFVNVVSIIRLRSLVKFGNSTNPTFDQWDAVYWSTLEVNIGMICTCLPTIRLILVRLFPSILGTGTKQGGYSGATAEPSDRTKGVSAGNYNLSHLTASEGNSWTQIDAESETELGTPERPPRVYSR